MIINSSATSANSNRSAISALSASITFGVIVFAVGVAAYSVSPATGAGSWWAGILTVVTATIGVIGAKNKSNNCARISFIVLSIFVLIIIFVGFLVDGYVLGSTRTTDGCFRLVSDAPSDDMDKCCEPSSKCVAVSGDDASDSCFCCWENDGKYTGFEFEDVDNCNDITGSYQRLLGATVAFNVLSFAIILLVSACFCCCHSPPPAEAVICEPVSTSTVAPTVIAQPVH